MPHQVRTNVVLVDLPGVGRIENSGQVVTLQDSDFSLIPASAFSGGSPILTDLGVVGSSGDTATTQAAFVAQPAALTSAAPAALTSAQNVTTNAVNPANAAYIQADQTTLAALANALKTSYNAAQADVAALRTTLAATQADVAALQASLAAVLTSLKGIGKPMAPS